MGTKHRPKRHGRGINQAMYELAGQREDLHGAVNPPEELLAAVIGTTHAIYGDRRVYGGSMPRALLARQATRAAERAAKSREAGVQFLTPDMVTPPVIDTDMAPALEIVTPLSA